MKVSSLGSIITIYLSSLASAAPHNNNILERGVLATAAANDVPCSNGIFVELPTGNKRVKSLDRCKTMPPHTCPRDALVALALWRDVCKGINKVDAVCWNRAPSIERCCGKWVYYDDKKWEHAGVYHSRVREDLYRDEKSGKVITVFNGPEKRKGKDNMAMRLIIKPSRDDYNTDELGCRIWRAQKTETYTAMMQNLPEYGLIDVNEKGELRAETGQLIGYMP